MSGRFRRAIPLFSAVLSLLILGGFAHAASGDVTLNSPSAGNITDSGGNITFNATVEINATIEIRNATLWGNFSSGTWAANVTNSTSPIANVTSFKFPSIILADGNYVWNVRVWFNDSSYYEAAANRTITIDTAVPAVTITRPSAENYSTASQTFNISLVERNPATILLQITPSGQGAANYTMINQSGGWGYTNASMPDSTYTILIFANDTAGHINFTTSATLRIDTAVPLTVTINAPVSGGTYTATPITLNVTAADFQSLAGGYIKNITYQLNSNSNATLCTTGCNNTPVTGAISNMIDGSNGISFFAWDNFGNMNASTRITFTYTLTYATPGGSGGGSVMPPVVQPTQPPVAQPVIPSSAPSYTPAPANSVNDAVTNFISGITGFFGGIFNWISSFFSGIIPRA